MPANPPYYLSPHTTWTVDNADQLGTVAGVTGALATVLDTSTVWMKTLNSGWQPVASLNIAGDAVIPPLNFHNLVSAYHSDVTGALVDGNCLVYRSDTGKWGGEPIVDTVARANANMTTQPRIFDDFISGSIPGLTGSSAIGQLGWTFAWTPGGNVGTAITGVEPTAGRVGVIVLETGATSGQAAIIHLRQDPTLGVVHTADTFDMTFVIRLVQSDANTQVRFGLGKNATGDPPGDGIYMEKLAADTQWFGVTRASSVQSRTVALGTTDTNWHKLRVRRKNASTISFSIDGGAETDATMNIPSTAVQPFAQVKTSAAINKKAEVDFIEVFMTGMRP